VDFWHFWWLESQKFHFSQYLVHSLRPFLSTHFQSWKWPIFYVFADFQSFDSEIGCLDHYCVLRGSTKCVQFTFHPKQVFSWALDPFYRWENLPFWRNFSTFSTQFGTFVGNWDFKHVVNVSQRPQNWQNSRSPRFNKVYNLLFTQNMCFLELWIRFKIQFWGVCITFRPYVSKIQFLINVRKYDWKLHQLPQKGRFSQR